MNEITKLKPKGMSDELILNQIKSEVKQKHRQSSHNGGKSTIHPNVPIVNSKFSMHFKDYHQQHGRYGIMTRMDFRNHS